jgi:hypothetical protein
MNSAIATIGKTLSLVAILTLTILNYFYNWLNFSEIVLIQLFIGVLYIFFSCAEYINNSIKADIPVNRFAYFPTSFYMFKTLKVGIFFMFGAMLLTTSSKISYLATICFIVGATELIVMAVLHLKKLCYVSFLANYIIIAGVKVNKLFANQIKLTEFRHDIFHFVKKDNSVLQLNLDFVNDKQKFKEQIKNWLVTNNVSISQESKEKLLIK